MLLISIVVVLVLVLRLCVALSSLLPLSLRCVTCVVCDVVVCRCYAVGYIDYDVVTVCCVVVSDIAVGAVTRDVVVADAHVCRL